jgi:ATP-dependent helicase HrpB
MQLPIDQIRAQLEGAITAGPVVLSAPTGSGKSTQVPRWLAHHGPVLVVEPRRVACQALATRIAELDGVPAGGPVGWIVRDDHHADPDARVVFVTPGVALRMARGGAGSWARFSTVVLDEFHERNLDLDLLLALLLEQRSQRLVVMSATLEGDRIAAHIGGQHIAGEGRQHPVETRYLPGNTVVPDADGLGSRVAAALDAAQDLPGDVLVFLPGKGEIADVSASLQHHKNVDVLRLHGGLSLRDQRRVFQPSARRRVVLATNVAETSLTIPRVGVVIDSGLVRRTRYRGGRGHLALMAVALDSANQRAGRAGRLGPGTAFRLWRADARLDAHTPPEVYRESLVPLVLAAAACGRPQLDLPFLDPPHAHAIADAREKLQQLDALDEDGALTERGARLFRLPIDPHLGRLVIEGERRGLTEVVVPLVAALSVNRRMFARTPEDPEDDLAAGGCDAVAHILAVREGDARRNGLDTLALNDARRAAKRIRRFLGDTRADTRGRSAGPASSPAVGPGQTIDRRALANAILAAWPGAAHIARRRRGRVAWSNGGTELELGRGSRVNAEKAPAILVLDSIALTIGARRDALVITAAMPVPEAWLVAAGIGRRRLAAPMVKRRRVLGQIEVVHAGKVLATEEERLRGSMLRDAVCELVLAGRMMKGVRGPLGERLQRLRLSAGLEGAPLPLPPPAWLAARIDELGLEDPEDLELIETEDLLPDDLPEWEREQLEREYPTALSVGDARYTITYDPERRVATLHQTGTRKGPPPERFLPRLSGWRIDWEHKKRVRTVRAR